MPGRFPPPGEYREATKLVDKCRTQRARDKKDGGTWPGFGLKFRAANYGGAHGRVVGDFVRASTRLVRGVRAAAWANGPVCSVSCSTRPTVTEIHRPD